jgi:Putative Flp pilus-assembly TadE/G-like
MAALAVDIVALYVAKSEAQRAADASALAAAKMFVSSGYTSNSAAITQSDLCRSGGPGGSGAANKAAEGLLAQNLVVGQAATLQTITCDFTQATNPLVTITVQRAGLPTLFGRIWGAGTGTVNATAKAEAFNPSGGSTNIAVGSVKPWLIPNCLDAACSLGGNFFTSTYGIAHSGAFIGNQIWTFSRLDPTNTYTPPPPPPPLATKTPPDWWFYALDPPQPNVCPSNTGTCNQIGTGPPGVFYHDNIACSNTAFRYTCGQQIGPGAPPSSTVVFDQRSVGFVHSRTIAGISCLIHSTNGTPPLTGQDSFSFAGPPVIISGSSNNPNAALQNVVNISRSDSVVTVPVYSGGNACPTTASNCTAQVIGFLQIGIQTVDASGIISAVIMNAAPCDPANNSGTPVVGGAVSPVPVRLVQP